MNDVVDVAAGLWIWRTPHDEYEWVTSTCVRSRGAVLALDARAPAAPTSEVWRRLDDAPPTALVVLKPDHVRSVDEFARRYGAKAYGPWLFWGGNKPATDLEPIEPEMELPGGLRTLYDGRGRMETPLWLPEQRTLVFADALAAIDGTLRVWDCPALHTRALPALRALLDLPFERVIVSHGDPVHDRAAYERALEIDAWRERG